MAQMAQMNCPVCDRPIWQPDERVEINGKIVASGHCCGKCRYVRRYEHAQHFAQVGEKMWGWSYDTPEPTELIEAAIAEARKKFGK